MNFCGDRLRIRNSGPGRIDSVEKRARHGLTFQRFEIFFSRSASRRAADALALVPSLTSRGNFCVSLAQKRIVTPRFQNGQTRWIEGKVAVRKEKRRRVPNQPRGLPRFHES